MYQKAREFRDIFTTIPLTYKKDPELEIANSILDKHAQTFVRKECRIRSEIMVMEKEIKLITDELCDFMSVYHQNFSTDPLSDSFEKAENISFFEKRTEAFSIILKQAYRRLVKALHPDMGDELDVKYFHRVQSLYEKEDLAELIYMQTYLKEKDGPTENAILKIERYEAAIKVNEKKLFRLIGKKSDIISSPQYQLFMKFKLSEVRGYGIFNKLNENSQIN